MTPNLSKISIKGNLELIRSFLQEVIISPRQMLQRWALITKQTPAAKLAYIGQHLASLITGVAGTSTGARGDDLADGSEVKSCNKVDQTDRCKDCETRVMRIEKVCPVCGGTNIVRKDDSKWLFSVRSEEELNQYLSMERIVLILMDYPGFENHDFSDIRIMAFEIYPREQRGMVICDLLRNHYYNIYLNKISSQDKTNPMNLHPFSYQFYKCNPVLIFECVIKNIDCEATVEFEADNYIPPTRERGGLVSSLPMPSRLLRAGEWQALIEKADYETEILPQMLREIPKSDFESLSMKQKREILPLLPESLKDKLPLREIVSIRQKTPYNRSRATATFVADSGTTTRGTLI